MLTWGKKINIQLFRALLKASYETYTVHFSWFYMPKMSTKYSFMDVILQTSSIFQLGYFLKTHYKPGIKNFKNCAYKICVRTLEKLAILQKSVVFIYFWSLTFLWTPVSGWVIGVGSVRFPIASKDLYLWIRNASKVFHDGISELSSRVSSKWCRRVLGNFNPHKNIKIWFLILVPILTLFRLVRQLLTVYWRCLITLPLSWVAWGILLWLVYLDPFIFILWYEVSPCHHIAVVCQWGVFNNCVCFLSCLLN